MLRVVDLATGSSLSCTLNPQTTVVQVIQAIKSRKSQQQTHAADEHLFAVWTDSHNQVKAKRMRSEDHPLQIVQHLQSTTNGKQTPRLINPAESCHLILARDESTFAQRGVTLDPHSQFFSIIQRLAMGDLCAYFITNNTIPAWWWVLHGEKLWFYAEGHENMSTIMDHGGNVVSLVDAKFVSLNHMEFEIQTPLIAYKFRATTSPADVKLWAETIQFRINVATDNEMLLLGDVMISDEERLAWKERDLHNWAMQMDHFDAWWNLAPARKLLVAFAQQTSQKDYELCLLYASMENAAPNAIVDQFHQYRGEFNRPGNESAFDSEWILFQVRQDLESGLFARLKQHEMVFERYIAGIPLAICRSG